MMPARSSKAEIRYDRIFEELPASRSPSSRTLLKVLCAAVCLGLAVSYIVNATIHKAHNLKAQEAYHSYSSPLKHSIPNPSKRAIVTSLYDDDYAVATRVLGQSLKDAQIDARRLVMYIPGQLSATTLCQLRHDGWELFPVERISPPQTGGQERFKDQFTKLQLWNMTDFEAVLYIDGDCIVKQNLDDIWQLPTDFAAVPDVWYDHKGFILGFNAGVLFVRPSTQVYNDILDNLPKISFDIFMIKQNFLNEWAKYDVLRLPYIWAANLAIKNHDIPLWRSLWPSMRIIHYTMAKPHWSSRDAQAGQLYEDAFELWWKYKDQVDLLDEQGVC